MTVIDCTQCPVCEVWSATPCDCTKKKTLTDGQVTALVEKLKAA